MSNKTTGLDPVEVLRSQLEALNRHDLDAFLRFYAPGCVVEQEMGTLEGVSAVRAVLEEWLGFYEEIEWESEEVVDLVNGVGFGVIRMHGRPVGSSGHVQMRLASVTAQTDRLVAWVRQYTETDIEKARTAAEQLAEEPEQEMPEKSTTPDRPSLCAARSPRMSAITTRRCASGHRMACWTGVDEPLRLGERFNGRLTSPGGAGRRSQRSRWHATRQVRERISENLRAPQRSKHRHARMR
jgi:hypothetical protein